MNSIKLKTWIITVITLFTLGLLADYYFLHILFIEKQQQLNGSLPESAIVSDSGSVTKNPEQATSEDLTNKNLHALGEKNPVTDNKDNFLVSLKSCAPEIAAQAIATPEALLEYLRKSIGVKDEDKLIENFHLLLKDGTQRRVHVAAADNTNEKNKKELHLFTLDAEGYPQSVPLKGDETLESLLALGQVQKHEVKSQLTLEDGGTVTVETHDNEVYEFQYTHENKILSCRQKDCQCP